MISRGADGLQIRPTRPALALGLLLAALVLPAFPARAATNDLTTALQRGLFEEEANQNLGAAIQAYQTVASQFDKDRKLAATAIFRLGECYRKQANTNEAAAQYQRILREFSDQPTLVTLSRQSLTALGSAPTAPGGPLLSDAARQEQKRLLEEEIKLVEKQLQMQQKQMEVGAAGPHALWPTEREILKLKRQVVALDAGLPISITATETAATATPAISDIAREEQKRLLEEEIKLVQKQLEMQQKQMRDGRPVSADDRLATERDLLKLKRQVAALDAVLPISVTATEAPASAISSDAEEVKRIEALIKDSPDLINAPDRKGVTLLQSAAAKGKANIVNVLLARGAAVDGLQQPGLTALHYAAANGHKAIADLLLSKGAKPDAQTENGVTPLHFAAQKGYESVAKTLLAAGAPVNAQTKGSSSSGSEDLQYSIGSGQSPLHLAAIAGYTGMVELLLAKGADANAEDGGGRTPLSFAAEKRYDAIVQLLLAAHANPNAGHGYLPLAVAAYLGDMPALKLLLANGADPNTNSTVMGSVRTRIGELGANSTPLFFAVGQRQADAAKELLRCKANPNADGPKRNPLLFFALSDAPTLKVLLEGGADPNVRTSPEGNPMLLQAVRDKNQPAVELLLAHKADLNAADGNGCTPLHWAAGQGDKAIAELLLKGGADLNARDKSGNTPLHIAVSDRQQALAELLLANKADPNARNNEGQTPLDVVKNPSTGGLTASMRDTLADLLRKHGAADDLPRLDRIGLRWPSTKYSSPVFTKGTNDWNQFTLFELIAVHYHFLAASPGGETLPANQVMSLPATLPFPDFTQLRIRRPTRNTQSWTEAMINLSAILQTTNCAEDQRLEWGDVVEIPEADHPLDKQWSGFPKADFRALVKCLSRQVQLVIKGQVTNITLAPSGEIVEWPSPRISQTPVHNAAFWVKPVVWSSGLVLASSDMSRVKVTRRDPATGQTREWVVDCSGGSPAPPLWLRDGDKIEVPEKTN